uniref:Uncharacterized protein n=1 Tax=viral metagenome TaxID=1070528 RepID=A0A6M3KWJ6_9ZZZZ
MKAFERFTVYPLLLIAFISILALDNGTKGFIQATANYVKAQDELNKAQDELNKAQHEINKAVIKAIYEFTQTGPASQQFKDAHKYHGIFASHWDEGRKDWVFDRGGKVCRLFGYGRGE